MRNVFQYYFSFELVVVKDIVIPFWIIHLVNRWFSKINPLEKEEIVLYMDSLRIKE